MISGKVQLPKDRKEHPFMGVKGCRAGHVCRIAFREKSIGGSCVRGIRGRHMAHCQRYFYS